MKILVLLITSFSLSALTMTREVSQKYFDGNKLDELEDYLFPDQKSDIQSNSLLIMKDNAIIYERYTPPYTPTTKLLSWSMAKTVTALLVGIAEKENILRRTDTLGEILKDLPPLKSTITITDLLHMSSGIKFSELYYGSIWKHDVHSMLFKNGARDVGKYVLQLPMSYKPGSRYYYSSGDTNLLMYALKNKMSKSEYDNYPFDKLFRPLGITSATFEQDESGTFIGSSFLYLTARDYAQLGLLFLNKGQYKGKSIVNNEWLEFLAKQSSGFNHPDNIDPDYGYGAQLWLNYTLKDGVKKIIYPSLPIDTIFFQGIKGQILTIIPSENLLFVRSSFDDDPGPHKDYYFSLLMQSLKNKKHTPIVYEKKQIRIKKEKPIIDSPILEEGKEEQDIGIHNSIFTFLTLGNKFTARMICSCHFVQKNDLSYCEKTFGRYTYVFKTMIEDDLSSKSKLVKVYNLLGLGTAMFRNEELGCTAL